MKSCRPSHSRTFAPAVHTLMKRRLTLRAPGTIAVALLLIVLTAGCNAQSGPVQREAPGTTAATDVTTGTQVPATDADAATAGSEGGPCEVEAVAGDLGDASAVDGEEAPQVVACDGSWAVFQTGYLPQHWTMARWSGTTWESAFGFPTAICRDDFLDLGGSTEIAAFPNWNC